MKRISPGMVSYFDNVSRIELLILIMKIFFSLFYLYFRSKSIEPEMKFEKVASRIAMFEGYIDETSRIQSPVILRKRSQPQTVDNNHDDKISLPPPRPPPPTDYINDAFRTSNYFSLPRNSRMICNSDDDLSANNSESKTNSVYKSSSFSNFPRTMTDKDIVAGIVHQNQRQNKSINGKSQFTTNNPASDQQKNAGRIIG